jgi:regulator of protease activity HflC (stomatin/prohibitin superfamily)
MDKVFGWIGEIFQTLLRLFPWLVIVPATHGGVAFVRGKHVREWKAGLHWYWPIVTTYKLLTVVRQTVTVQSKVTMTRDMKPVLVGSLITYEVTDVVTAAARIADLLSDVIERSLPVLLGRVASMTLEEINADRKGFNNKLTGEVAAALDGYGVQVLQAQLTELSPCRTIAFTGHAAVGQYTLWTGL